jgi:hypothetical protein
MNSDLTLEQLQQLLDRALRLRTKEIGISATDRLFIAVDRAHVHLQDLRMHLHYAVCNRVGSGTRSQQDPDNAGDKDWRSF